MTLTCQQPRRAVRQPLHDSRIGRIIRSQPAAPACHDVSAEAFTIFLRDVTRLCDYFRRQGLDVDPVGIAYDLWETWVG